MAARSEKAQRRAAVRARIKRSQAAKRGHKLRRIEQKRIRLGLPKLDKDARKAISRMGLPDYIQELHEITGVGIHDLYVALYAPGSSGGR